MTKLTSVCALALAAVIPVLQAQDEAPAPASASPLYEGAYLAPMASYVITDAERLDDGYGGVLAAGYRFGSYALEFSGIYSSLSAEGGEDVRETGGSLGGLLFPLDSLPNLFLIGQGGAIEIKHYPMSPKSKTFGVTTFAGGLGHLFDFSIGNYEFALRTEALYRYGIRESNYKPGNDYDAPRRFKDVLINVGLQLPLGLKAPPPPPEPVVEVVPVLPPADSDGDGVTDDLDQCPGTPTGAAIDSKGCELPPPCKSVPAGEHIVLGGCAAGDVLVLHGVTFEFDQARLTANAQVILDNVVEELKAYPTIQVELRGHTDSRGSDSYNQRLSEQRAQAVLDYLVESGIGSERVTAAGYGESEPVADNETDEGRELNRRVELKVTEGGVSVAGAAITEAAPPEEAADTAEPASFEMQ